MSNQAAVSTNMKMEPQTTSERDSVLAASADTRPQPPVAPCRPVEHRLHGDLRVDDYSWLREKENPEVIQHLEAENAYTRAELQPTEPFQETLYQEMLSRIQQTDLSVPYLLRGYFYFTKTVEGRQYPLHYRRRLGQSDQNDSADDSTTDELLLDLNALAEGQSLLGMGAFEVSDNNRWLAYSIDTTGFRQYLLQIKDLQTLDTLPFRA